jgi:hypothetical protein
MSFVGRDINGNPLPAMRQGVVTAVAYGVAAGSKVLAENTRVIRIIASTDCYYLVSIAGTAATNANGSLLPAGQVELLGVPKGSTFSVVRSAADGTLNLTEGA